MKRLIKRALELFKTVPGGYAEAAKDILDEGVGEATEPFGARAIHSVLGAEDVRARALAKLATAPDQAVRLRRIGQLNDVHRRWVGPVRLVAHGIRPLWAVPIGPVPAGAIATVVLLGYTVGVTGDLLDSSRRFVPDIRAGVVRRAGGE